MGRAWHSQGHLLLLSGTLLLCSITGCSSTGKCFVSGALPDSLRSIYVVRRGWHTGIVVAAADWPNRGWILLTDFPNVDYLEFGWGDERFYQAERNTLWLGSRAALWPTSSVIHVIGLPAPVTGNAHADEIVEVRIPIDGLRRLTTAIEQEFAGDRPTPSGSALSSAPTPNRFYEAKRSFFFPLMCNWWIATRLQEAGCPIQPWSVVTASRVMREAREFGAQGRADGSDHGRVERPP